MSCHANNQTVLKTYLENHEELLIRLNHLVQLTDVLVAEFLHGFNLCPHAGQVILRNQVNTISNTCIHTK